MDPYRRLAFLLRDRRLSEPEVSAVLEAVLVDQRGIVDTAGAAKTIAERQPRGHAWPLGRALRTSAANVLLALAFVGVLAGLTGSAAPGMRSAVMYLVVGSVALRLLGYVIDLRLPVDLVEQLRRHRTGHAMPSAGSTA